MPDREKVIRYLESFVSIGSTKWSPHRIDESWKELQHLLADALAMLKEHENQKQNWLKQIADTQLLNAPCEWQAEDQRLYAKGVWDGLQIALDIISEGR